jgi:uncharacterized repeat protein (TIGR01451 family)
MHVKNLRLLILSVLFAASLKAQMTYTVGTLTLSVIPNYNHDSTWCQSSCMFVYSIQKSTSFLNDTIIVKDQYWGNVVYYFVNTTGASPWNTSAPMTYGGIPIISDANLNQPGNNAYFMLDDYKIINGTDTIYNIHNQFFTSVPNACSYDTVKGRVYIDQNSDCVYNAGDIGLQSVNVNYDDYISNPSPSSFTSSGYTTGGGLYFAKVQKSWMTSYGVYMPSQYQFIFPSTACSPLTYSYTSLPQNNVDFSLQCGSVVDVETWIGASGFARPLIPFYLSPAVNNTGCDSASGVLKLILDPRVIYNAGLSSFPATSVNGDTLFWNYTNLTNLSNGAYWNSFIAGVHLTPNGSVNIGDTLCFSTIITVPGNDANAANNTSAICLPVVNSHDPNEKTVSPAGLTAQGYIPASTQYLEYTIHFQNTGNVVAYNIAVIDTLDANIIPSSLQIIGTSDAMIPSWKSNNVVRFDFNNIYLADSTSNEAASHGVFTFRVKINSSLPALTQIKNRGYIYFDGNPAIITNTALNTIQASSVIKELSTETFAMMPNPATTEVTLVFSHAAKRKIYVTDISGKKVFETEQSGTQTSLNTSDLQSGIYFVQLVENGKADTRKLVVNR